MASLSEIRAKLKEQENRIASGSTSGGDNAIYPFWNMKEGETATFRFLPDGNDKNTFFWVERLMIKLPFAGVKGEADSRPVQVQVPCMEMYGETCPILAEVRPWFKDKSLEDMGRKYWKKKSYIFQGFVTDNPLKEETTPENSIRRFIIGPQIFQIVKQALMDPDMENNPTEYTSGTDFRLNKTSKGGYADYGTSVWARRERPLSDAEMQSIQKNGLFNLADFLPKKPTDVELKIISEMFEASVDGEAYNTDRWGQYFRPAGISSKTGDPVSSTTVNNIDPEDDVPVKTQSRPIPTKQEEPKTETQKPANGSAADILAMIKARQNKG